MYKQLARMVRTAQQKVSVHKYCIKHYSICAQGVCVYMRETLCSAGALEMSYPGSKVLGGLCVDACGCRGSRLR